MGRRVWCAIAVAAFWGCSLTSSVDDLSTGQSQAGVCNHAPECQGCTSCIGLCVCMGSPLANCEASCTGSGGGLGWDGGSDAANAADSDADSADSARACGFTTLPECRACYEANCCAQSLSCYQNADCTALVYCIDDCAPNYDGSCTDPCWTAHPEGEAYYMAISNCMAQKCTTC